MFKEEYSAFLVIIVTTSVSVFYFFSSAIA